MLDNEVTLTKLKKEVNKFVEERDWSKYHNPKDLAISISIESSELLEHFQWIDQYETMSIIKDAKKKLEIEAELADVVIYCLSLANVLSMDLAKAIIDKIKENKNKYPVEKFKGVYLKP